MSIVQISKIQVRTGDMADIPQLSEGELGWASDEKRLFIGNNPNTLGALPNNTEILTEYSPLPMMSLTSLASSSYSAAAWVNFNGNGDIGSEQIVNASANVSSVHKNGVGDYTINFSSALQDAYFATSASAQLTWVNNSSGIISILVTSTTDSSVRIKVLSGNGSSPFVPTDSSMISVVIHR